MIRVSLADVAESLGKRKRLRVVTIKTAHV